LLSSARAKAALGALIALLATAGVVVPGLDGEESRAPSAAPAGVLAPEAARAELDPSEVAEITRVLSAIDSGAPLPYSEDGQTFQNREGLLPAKPLGYYREYTVETPGSPDRGARRLVIGEQGETYYTDDHYASFTRVDPGDFGQ
jgi:ribonuclease T1